MFLPDGFAYTGAAFSPDGKTLAVPSNGHALDNKRGVRLVEVATGREMGMLPLEGNGFYSSVDFTPDGKWLVTAGQDCNVTVWDLSSRTVVFKDEVHWPLNCARFSPDGHSLVAAGEGGVVKSYMVTEKDKKLTVQNQQGSPRFLDASYSLVFAPDGKSLFVCGRTKIVVWDTQVWQQRKTFDGGNVALSRDGKLLAVADFGNRIVTIWDAVKYLEQKDAALLGPRLVGPQAGLRRSAQDEARYVAEAQAALKAYLRGEAGAAGPRPGAPNHTLDRAAAVDRFGELQEITGQGYSQAVWNIQGYDYLIAGRTARFAKGAVPLKIYVTEGGKTAPGEAAVRVTALHYDHSNGMVAYVAHPDLVAPGSP